MLHQTIFERLNALAEINSASKYLEIGTAKGKTFFKVNVSYKVAVDPQFRFDINSCNNKNCFFHQNTSDVFYATQAINHGEFDLIYLDGLHTFEQTFRDFCASLSCSNKQTIWLIDDVYPLSLLESIPDQKLVQRLRKLLRIKTNRWTGDVFKVVFTIHDFFPNLSYATFPGPGNQFQTVVWVQPRDNFSPTWNSLEKISNLKYRDFLKFKNSHLFIEDTFKILEYIKIKFH